MMRPDLRSAMCLPAAWEHRNSPVRFTRITRSHSSAGISSTGQRLMTPAALSCTSMCPYLSMAAATMPSTLA